MYPLSQRGELENLCLKIWNLAVTEEIRDNRSGGSNLLVHIQELTQHVQVCYVHWE
jgi:hypothetical protein